MGDYCGGLESKTQGEALNAYIQVLNPSTFYRFAAAIAVLILLVPAVALLSPWKSSPTNETGGISAVAGGVSEGVFSLLLVATAVLLIVLFLALRKSFRKPK